ncbi:hypothetical protein C0583_05850 [Candidatus Parcubacteria bacterium]|nr:MAG: hypothetical protein C0583_05850 [Candidatus Parcubacteria bacterium]
MQIAKKIFSFVLLFSLFLGLATAVDANSGSANNVVWGGQAENIQSRTALGNDDPRLIAANIINLILGFLGILSVCIILYAGFRWMTAAGNTDQVDSAKKTLSAGVIGLVIILASYALASFVLDAIFRVTTNDL